MIAGVAVQAQSPGEAVQLASAGSPVALLGMPEETYHAHPALSASSMKVLLRSPKAFRYARQVPPKPKPEFDVGHAVHARVLGVGMPVVQIPAELLSSDGGIRSGAAKDWVAKAHADGKVPLKPAVHREVVMGSDAVLQHPKARAILERGGVSEVSLFAKDPGSGVALRGRIDRTFDTTIVDVKTCTSLALRKLQMVVDDFSYDLSMETYRFLFELVTGSTADRAVLIFMEKDPPFDVRVVTLGETWSDGGWQKLRRAIDVYAECEASGVWPGVDDGDGEPVELEAPGWYSSRVDRGALETVEAV